MTNPHPSLSIVRSATTSGRRAIALALVGTALTALSACADRDAPIIDTAAGEVGIAPDPIDEGRQIFRFETFGNEQFWTDTARMHEVIARSVSPTLALEVGLKVDADAIPADVALAIKEGPTTVGRCEAEAVRRDPGRPMTLGIPE